MFGPDILARSLSKPNVFDGKKMPWQYHSRSDSHSKIGSWGVAFDLLSTSSLLRSHARDGKVVLGINHEMTDYATGRKKDLDLVFARPGDNVSARQGETLESLVTRYGIELSTEQEAVLSELPQVSVAPVGAVLIALEAKAAMTAHVKALPRLYDELNSSHLCVHGASSQALAIAYVQVNIADTFVSPNPENTARMAMGMTPFAAQHKQPHATQRVLDKISEIPRRSGNNGIGFDAIGISVVKLHNDGSPVTLHDDAPAPKPGDPFHYGGMIIRMANEYDATFSKI